MGDVFLYFIGLLQKIHGENLFPEIPFIERLLQNHLIEMLELSQREFGGKSGWAKKLNEKSI